MKNTRKSGEGSLEKNLKGRRKLKGGINSQIKKGR